MLWLRSKQVLFVHARVLVVPCDIRIVCVLNCVLYIMCVLKCRMCVLIVLYTICFVCTICFRC